MADCEDAVTIALAVVAFESPDGIAFDGAVLALVVAVGAAALGVLAVTDAFATDELGSDNQAAS